MLRTKRIKSLIKFSKENRFPLGTWLKLQRLFNICNRVGEGEGMPLSVAINSVPLHFQRFLPSPCTAPTWRHYLLRVVSIRGVQSVRNTPRLWPPCTLCERFILIGAFVVKLILEHLILSSCREWVFLLHVMIVLHYTYLLVLLSAVLTHLSIRRLKYELINYFYKNVIWFLIIYSFKALIFRFQELSEILVFLRFPY